MSRLTVIGDALLDHDLDGRAERLAPDAPVPVVDAIAERPRAGGAGLAATLAAAAGHDVTLVCALGADAAGEQLRRLLEAAGVAVVDLGLHGATPEKIRVRAGGQVLVRLDRGDATGCGPLDPAALPAADAVLVSDYGRGVTAEPTVRAALRGDVPLVWDPHPRGAEPVAGATLVTPNLREAVAASRRDEAATPIRDGRAGSPGGAQPAPPGGDTPGSRRGDIAGSPGGDIAGSHGGDAAGSRGGRTAGSARVDTMGSLGGDTTESPRGGTAGALGGDAAGSRLAAAEAAARALVRRWRAVGVCVTLGRDGAVLVGGDGPVLAVPAPSAHGDPCGAGDCFAVTAAARLAAGGLPSEAVLDAVEAASAFVAGGGAAGAGPAAKVRESAAALAARVRRAGGTVVATGGCFDLLHAGHVRMLERARALGDCLIVCLNSDASVARLKGPDRPLVDEDDRAAVLAALGCVDAVVVFDEDDPSTALCKLRPHVWVKGGDYALSDLPEAAVIAGWGGRAVLVPYVAGRSTSLLIDKAAANAG